MFSGNVISADALVTLILTNPVGLALLNVDVSEVICDDVLM
jgi:hypothetical protein